MNKYFLCLHLLFLGLFATAQNEISGTVVDATDQSPLPFANLQFEGTTLGTTCNTKGQFTLHYKANQTDAKVVFSSVGYKNISKPLKDFINKGKIIIKLQAETQALKEVVVRPQPPIYYLKQAMSNVDAKYNLQKFMTYAFYRTLVTDNNQLINLEEGYFKSQIQDFHHTKHNEHQLLLYRNLDTLQELYGKAFQEQNISVKTERTAEDLSMSKIFGGPDKVLNINFFTLFAGANHKKHPDSLSKKWEKRLNKFTLSFGSANTYKGHNIVEIQFKANEEVDHTKLNGSVYIDPETYTAVFAHIKGTITLPAAAKAVFSALGFSMQNLKIETYIQYQYFNNKWYPQFIDSKGDVDVVYNDSSYSKSQSHTFVEQQLSINKIVLPPFKAIEKSKHFKAHKKMSEQVFNDEKKTWDNVQIVPLDIPKE